jgi:hypothetical protein
MALTLKTLKEIENAKPKDKKYKMLDGGGLSLLVLPTGTKLWLWRYQFNGGEKNMKFGEYTGTVPPDNVTRAISRDRWIVRSGPRNSQDYCPHAGLPVALPTRRRDVCCLPARA